MWTIRIVWQIGTVTGKDTQLLKNKKTLKYVHFGTTQ